ncbi:MAG: Ppx/GppA phosphatase family protein [Syntrophomonadaceae bacterium]
MNLAAVDIGTNSCRLYIARASAGRLFTLYRDLETTRIGEGVSASSLLKPEAILRTVECLKRYKEIMQTYRVKKQRIIATSAVREARNREEFVALVKRELDLTVEVISGEEEAWLSYQGVSRGLDLAGEPLLADLGGGSTELVWREEGRLMLLSLPVGAVRAAEGNMSLEQIRAVLTPLTTRRDVFDGQPLVFVGGTATSVVAIMKGLEEYDREVVHGQVVKLDDVRLVYEKLQRMNLEQLLATPGIQKKRADIITKGVLVMLSIIEEMGKGEVIVSESDLMDAIIWELYEG